MSTANVIIEAAMNHIGLMGPGDTVSGEDADLCLRRLNVLIDSWENEGILGYTHVVTTFTLPGSTASRTIGPTLQININRPVRIEPSSFSRVDGIDVPLRPIDIIEYNKIRDKAYESTYPTVCWFDGDSPTGVVYFWPVPSQSVEVHLVTPESGGIAVLTTDYIFPPGYQRALEKNLAVEIAPDFGVDVPPFIAASAMVAKRYIKRQNSRVSQLTLPTDYNPYRSDILSGDEP